MKHGELVNFMSGAIDMEQVYEDLSNSLGIMHRAGVCHCDIRSSNILKFGSKYQLIDYDLALTADETMSFVEGAQFDSRGACMKQNGLDAAPFRWTTADDFDMLARFFATNYPQPKPRNST